ncbi:MAG: transcriptional regulator [Halanaerobiales bacterium]|nr:transcriptional regulator [Halanaerobiales bacterium]
MVSIFSGERLFKLRKKKKLSLEEVAAGVGVTSSHISQMENGKRQPSFGLLSALSNFFDIDPIFFIDTKGKYYGHGCKLRAYREKQGIDLSDIAKQVDMDEKVLMCVEEGESRLEEDQLEQMGRVVGVDLIDFEDSIMYCLNAIREICMIALNMPEEEAEEIINLIRTKI